MKFVRAKHVSGKDILINLSFIVEIRTSGENEIIIFFENVDDHIKLQMTLDKFQQLLNSVTDVGVWDFTKED